MLKKLVLLKKMMADNGHQMNYEWEDYFLSRREEGDSSVSGGDINIWFESFPDSYAEMLVMEGPKKLKLKRPKIAAKFSAIVEVVEEWWPRSDATIPQELFPDYFGALVGFAPELATEFVKNRITGASRDSIEYQSNHGIEEVRVACTWILHNANL